MNKPTILEVILSISLMVFAILYLNAKRYSELEHITQRKQIYELKERIQQDSIHIEMVEYNYNVLFNKEKNNE